MPYATIKNHYKRDQNDQSKTKSKCLLKMNDIIKKIINELPNCLNKFNVNDTDVTLSSSWNNGDSFITKQVSCTCGNNQLRLLTYELIEMKGFFKKREMVTKYAPVFVECPECNKNQLLFDPEIHGWNGSQNHDESQLKINDAVHFSDNVGRVFVNYSYQGTENYQEMLEDEDIDNPQDYFDTFSVYFEEEGNDINEVTSDECA